MKDKFPKIYKSKVDNIKTKIQKEFYCNANQEIKRPSKELSKTDLIKKINDIFLRPDYVYQADITILYKNGKNINKKIVGIKDENVITLDGDKINVNDILDIK